MKIRGGYQPEAGPKPPPNPPSGGSSVRPAPGPCRLCNDTKAENYRLWMELDMLGVTNRALARQLADMGRENERLRHDLERLNERRNWVIRKRGYFYRPNYSGYTSSIREAGRYSEAEALREAAIEPWCLSAHPASEFGGE